MRNDKLHDEDPAAAHRKRYHIRRSVAISAHMFEQIQEIAQINDLKPGIIMRKALAAGLQVVKQAEFAERERRRSE